MSTSTFGINFSYYFIMKCLTSSFAICLHNFTKHCSKVLYCEFSLTPSTSTSIHSIFNSSIHRIGAFTEPVSKYLTLVILTIGRFGEENDPKEDVEGWLKITRFLAANFCSESRLNCLALNDLGEFGLLFCNSKTLPLPTCESIIQNTSSRWHIEPLKCQARNIHHYLMTF